MDELEISGKRYISTRRAAREHGYHSDYMGQLIRGKKVGGQKVGRAWYIEEDSLNAYLGKAPAPTLAPAAQVTPAPIERLVIEEPVPVAIPEPEPVVPVAAPELAVPEPAVMPQVDVAAKDEPIAVRIEPEITEPLHSQPGVQEIHHAPYIEEQETRIPIRTQAQAQQEMGGLRYAADDAPSIPLVTRMPRMQAGYASARHSPAGKFPFISLSVVGIVAIVAATFASNFVSATVVSQPGKAATVHYAIHW
jgi:hypothetical protein